MKIINKGKNKSKVILTALMIIFLASGNASAMKKLKKKVVAGKKVAGQLKRTVIAGDKPLHTAVRFGNVERMKEICSECNSDPEIINKQNIDGETPLMLAFLLDPTKYSSQKREFINYLINNANADVNIPDYDGNSILHRILTLKYVPYINDLILLLMAGANVNHINNKNKSIWDAFFSIKDGRDGKANLNNYSSPDIIVSCYMRTITLLMYCYDTDKIDKKFNSKIIPYILKQNKIIMELNKTERSYSVLVENLLKEIKDNGYIDYVIPIESFINKRNESLDKYQLLEQKINQ